MYRQHPAMPVNNIISGIKQGDARRGDEREYVCS